MAATIQSIITVTLNPTIDRVMEVPGFRIGGHLRGRMRSRTPSGKAFNVSRALGVLGVPNVAAGFMGRDALQQFESAATAAGATPRFTALDAPTRENITILDPDARIETHVRDRGPKVTTADIERLAGDLALLVHAQALVVFSGSTPPGMPGEQFGRLIDVCTAVGARVAVDTSLEPLSLAATRPVWLLKPNLLELGELVGRELTDDEAILAAARELNARIPFIIVTLGERGAYCLAEGRTLYGRGSVPRDRIRSTVGCGDAFMAGFLATICSADGTVESAFRHALAVAAASAMSDQPAIFAAQDINWATGRVEISSR